MHVLSQSRIGDGGNSHHSSLHDHYISDQIMEKSIFKVTLILLHILSTTCKSTVTYAIALFYESATKYLLHVSNYSLLSRGACVQNGYSAECSIVLPCLKPCLQGMHLQGSNKHLHLSEDL